MGYVGSYKLALPPTVYVYLFPELFAKRAKLGGFRSPISGAKVKHDSLATAMSLAAVLYMYYRGVIDFSVVKEGRIFKSEKIVVRKLVGNVRKEEFGVISSGLSRIRRGGTIKLEDLIRYVMIRTQKVCQHFIWVVRTHDVEGRVSWPLTQDRLDKYFREAVWLRDLINYYKSVMPHLCELIEKNSYSAILSMVEVETGDY